MYAVRPEICGSHLAPEKFRVCDFVIYLYMRVRFCCSRAQSVLILIFFFLIFFIVIFVARACWRIYDRSKGYKRNTTALMLVMAISHLLS